MKSVFCRFEVKVQWLMSQPRLRFERARVNTLISIQTAHISTTFITHALPFSLCLLDHSVLLQCVQSTVI